MIYYAEKKGSVTVFFSLILLTVLSLLTTMLETARISAAEGISEGILELGTKSVLSSYYLPLFENYHVFGRWDKDGRNNGFTNLAQEISGYVSQNTGDSVLLTTALSDIKVEEYSTLLDQNGAFFYEQVLQYAKYQAASQVLEKLLTEIGVFEKMNTTTQILQRKYQVESHAAEVEEDILKFAGMVDGFSVENGFFSRNFWGQIKTRDVFVKKLIPGFSGASSAYLQDKTLYEAQKHNYSDPIAWMGRVQIRRDDMLECERVLELLYKEKEETEYLLQLFGGSKKEYDAVQKLNETLQRVNEEIEERESWHKEFILEGNQILSDIADCIQNTIAITERALDLLDEIVREKQKVLSGVHKYQGELNEVSGDLEPDIYSELTEDAASLEGVFSGDTKLGVVTDFAAARSNLVHNLDVLKSSLSIVHSMDITMLHGWQEMKDNFRDTILDLYFSGLKFEYGDMLTKKEDNSLGKMINRLKNAGVLALVVEDTSKLSDAEIVDYLLPSEGYVKESLNGWNLSGIFSGNFDGGINSLAKKAGVLVEAGVRESVEQLLYLIYLERYFPDYLQSAGGKEQGENLEGICYQKEYILCGNKSDMDNLSVTAQKIFLIRFINNLAAIIGSRECRGLTKATAAAMVGVTGVSALVSLMQFLIEVLWAVECAVVETAALLMGNQCSFWTTSSGLAVKYHELTLFGSDLVFTKAKTMKTGGGVIDKYDEYLLLLLLIENKDIRTLRTMDVIQQTLQIKEKTDFLFADCVGRLQVSAKADIPYRFLIFNRDAVTGNGVSRTITYGVSY